MVQAVTYKMQHTLLRVLVHKSTNSLLLLEQTGMMPTEEVECRAVRDEMLFIPNMAKAMPAEPLLTWDVVMPPLHNGQLPEAAETEAQYQITLPGRCWQGQEVAAVPPLRPLLCIAAPEPAQIFAGGCLLGWAGAGVQPLLLLFRCCMMAELSRGRSCKMSSGAAARTPPPLLGRMHRFNVLPEALQACSAWQIRSQ